MGHISCATTLVVLQRDHSDTYRRQPSLVDECGDQSRDSGAMSSTVARTREELLMTSHVLQARSVEEAARFRRRTADVLALQHVWQAEAARLSSEYEAIARAPSAPVRVHAACECGHWESTCVRT